MNGLLCLKWNNHSSTFYKTLTNQRSKELYCDATIVCHGKYFPVHRLVLTICSEYFAEIFEKTKCKHPFIIVKDILPQEIDALLNYMYKGEVNVLQDLLPGLINAAESLKIKGLAVPDDEDNISVDETIDPSKDKKRFQNFSPQSNAKRSRKVLQRKTPIIESNSSQNSVDDSKCIDQQLRGESKSVLAKEKSNVIDLGDMDSKMSHCSSNNGLNEDPTLDMNKTETNDSVDVKIEPIDFPEDNDHVYLGRDDQVDSENEGSLFQTLLGSTDIHSDKEKKKNESLAQCSSWDENLQHSNDENQSSLNADNFPDNMKETSNEKQNSDKDLDELNGFFDLPLLCMDQFNSSVVECAKIRDKNHCFPSAEEIVSTLTSTDNVKHCPYCPYNSKVIAHVKRHIMCKHTMERPFKCTMCVYSTANKSNMKLHMLIHTGEKTFRCPRCPYRAIRKDYMSRHIRGQHPDTFANSHSSTIFDNIASSFFK